MATTQRSSTAGVKTALGMSVEAAYGTALAPSVYIPFEDHNIEPSNKLIINSAVRKSVGQPQPGLGSVEVKGQITTFADADVIGNLLVAGMGKDTVTGAAGNYLHTLSLSNPLNSYCFAADDGQGSLQSFVGCKVNQLDISCKSGDFLKIKADILGQTSVVSTASLSPTFSNRDFFEFAHLGLLAGGTSTVNGVNVDVTDFQIQLKNNLKPHMGSTGGRFVVGMNETMRDVSGTFTLEYDSNVGDSMNVLLWGSATGPTASKLTRVPAVFTFAQPASGGLTPSISFQLAFITVQDISMTRKRGDILVQSVKFIVSETTGQADDLKILIANTAATAYQ